MGKAFEHATVWSGVAEIFFGKFYFNFMVTDRNGT